MQLERQPPELTIPGLNPEVMSAALGPRLTLLWGAAAPARGRPRVAGVSVR